MVIEKNVNLFNPICEPFLNIYSQQYQWDASSLRQEFVLLQDYVRNKTSVLISESLRKEKFGGDVEWGRMKDYQYLSELLITIKKESLTKSFSTQQDKTDWWKTQPLDCIQEYFVCMYKDYNVLKDMLAIINLTEQYVLGIGTVTIETGDRILIVI